RTGTGESSTLTCTDATPAGSVAVPVTVSVYGGAGTVLSCGKGSKPISGALASARTSTSRVSLNGTVRTPPPGSVSISSPLAVAVTWTGLPPAVSARKRHVACQVDGPTLVASVDGPDADTDTR